MSCTVMYQPYAMYSSSCDRSSSEKHKLFKFPTAPSPPDSLHSDASSYNSPGPLSVGGTGSSGASATVTTATAASSQSQSSQQSRRPLTPASNTTITSARGPTSSSSSTSGLTSSGGGGGSSSSNSTVTASATATSTNSNSGDPTLQQQQQQQQSSVSHSHRAHYLSANCVVFVHYHGDVSRVVDEHFSRALSAAYSNDKSTKSKESNEGVKIKSIHLPPSLFDRSSPMSTRNFPPSFWNSNYQPTKQLSAQPFASYGEFFPGSISGHHHQTEYSPSIPGLTHHHQTDPWHYQGLPLPPHQGYHHRATEIPYPPMPSSSRFNAAQYGSFLLAGAAAGSAAGRFPGMPTASQCGVKGESTAWGSGPYHDRLSDLHLADYSAAAAAHYSNMTAGLETSVQDSSSKGGDLYWF